MASYKGFASLLLVGALTTLAGCGPGSDHGGTGNAASAGIRSESAAAVSTSAPPTSVSHTASDAAAAAADFSFSFRQHLRKSPDPSIPVIYELIEAGDFNGDGRKDLVAFQNDNQIELLLQRADGTFATPLLFSRGSATSTAWPHFVVADFNSDGIDDLAFNVTNDWGAQGGVSMLLSRRGLAPVLRSVSAPGLVTSGSDPVNWIAVDFNSDGRSDLVAFHNGAEDFNPAACPEAGLCPHFSVQYGDGKGSLTPPEAVRVDLSYAVGEVVGEDIDRDGLQDMVFVGDGFGHTQTPAPVTYASKLPGKGFAKPVELHETVTESNAYFFADINGDGRRDSIRGTEIHLRQANGQFGSRLWLHTYNSTSIQPALGDFDGDGLTDLVNHQFQLYESPPFFALYLQRGGTLQAPIRFYEPPLSHGLAMDYYHRKVYAVGDFNGDRCRDIAVAANYDGIVFLDGKNCIPMPLPRTGGNLPPLKLSP